MELRADHEAPPHNNRGITLWPMRHHHETVMELRPDHTKNHVSPTKHKIIMHTNFMSTFITNNTSHVFLPFDTLYNNISLTSSFINAYQCSTQPSHGSSHNNTRNSIPFKHT